MMSLGKTGWMFAAVAAPLFFVTACSTTTTDQPTVAPSPTEMSSQPTTDPSGTTLPSLPPISSTPNNEAVTAALQGLALEDAMEKVSAAGYSIRVASVDGEQRALTMDYSESRINVDVVDGKVVSANVG